MRGSLASRILKLERLRGRGLGRAGQFGSGGDDAIGGIGKGAFAVWYYFRYIGICWWGCRFHIRVCSVFPSVQSVRLFPRTGRTPYSLPLPGTDAGL